MKKLLFPLVIASGLLVSVPASAHVDIGLDIGIPGPVYAEPAYVAPAPVPVYAAPPAYPVYYGHRHYWHGRRDYHHWHH